MATSDQTKQLPKAGRPFNPAGRKTTRRGYVIVRDDDGDWASEHRVVVEQHLGRKLRTEEKIKWRDGDRTNNNIDNLEVWELVRTWPT